MKSWLNIVKCASLLPLVLLAVGCRIKAVESMHSATRPDPKGGDVYGDPYTFGGIADGTGGQVAATTQSMESPSYADPKFKKIASKEGFTSMSGHVVSDAKGSETSGDYQPLPSSVEPKHGANGESEH